MINLNEQNPKFRVLLYPKIGELVMTTGRQWSNADIARDAGIHYNTVANLAPGHTRRVDLTVIEKLVGFFRRTDVPCTISDLIVEGDTA